MFSSIKVKENLKILNFQVLKNNEHITLLLYKRIKINGHSVEFGQLVQKLRYSWVLQIRRAKQDKG